MTMTKSMTRWITGHHLFVAMIQGLLVSISSFENALKKEDLNQAAKELLFAAQLMEASALAMKFAADFPESHYTDDIRPSLPDRFSGLDSLDHVVLVKQLKSLKSIFTKLPDELSEAKQIFDISIAKAYDAHVLVCDKFVKGEESLRTPVQGSSSTDILQTFKKTRLVSINASTTSVQD